MRVIAAIGKIDNPKFVLVQDDRIRPIKKLNELVILHNNKLKVLDKIPEQLKGSNQVQVFSVALSKIHINKQLFQNRETDFSQDSVNRIIQAVNDGSFSWQVFDPILLWENPENGFLYVLSGHSRTAAFEILSSNKITYQGKTFDEIPAKIIKTSLQNAQKIAMESNVLSTKESDLERANYYRKLKNSGTELKELKKMIEKNEGKNANKILAFSFLDPNGKTYDAVRNIDRADVQSRNIINTVAFWIGMARMRFSALSLLHENELFEFLIIHGGYGNKAGQISNINEFLSRIEDLILKSSYFGKLDPEKPLNIRKLIYKDAFQLEYESKLNEVTRELKEALKIRDAKLKEYVNRRATDDQIKAGLKRFDDDIIFFQRKYNDLLKRKEQVFEASKAQTSLFGFGRCRSIGNIGKLNKMIY